MRVSTWEAAMSPPRRYASCDEEHTADWSCCRGRAAGEGGQLCCEVDPDDVVVATANATPAVCVCV